MVRQDGCGVERVGIMRSKTFPESPFETPPPRQHEKNLGTRGAQNMPSISDAYSVYHNADQYKCKRNDLLGVDLFPKKDHTKDHYVNISRRLEYCTHRQGDFFVRKYRQKRGSKEHAVCEDNQWIQVLTQR